MLAGSLGPALQGMRPMQIDPQFCHVLLTHVVCVTSVPVWAVPGFADFTNVSDSTGRLIQECTQRQGKPGSLSPMTVSAAEPPPAPCSGPAHLISGTQAAPVYVMPSLAKSSSSGCGIPVSNGQGPSTGASDAGSGGDCECCMPCASQPLRLPFDSCLLSRQAGTLPCIEAIWFAMLTQCLHACAAPATAPQNACACPAGVLHLSDTLQAVAAVQRSIADAAAPASEFLAAYQRMNIRNYLMIMKAIS